MCQEAREQKLLGKIFMADDPLRFLVNPLHFAMRNHIKIINIIKSIIVLYLQIFNVIGIIYICNDKTGTYMQRYISVILAQQVGIGSLVLQICFTKSIVRLVEAIQTSFLPINIAGKKVHQDLLRQCSLARKQFCLAFIVAVPMMCNVFPLIVGRGDVQFAVTFIKEHFTVWASFCEGIYYLCLIALGYGIASASTACLYLMMHLKFQFQLLSEYLKQITSDYESNYENNLYQEAVRRRLKSFVQAHNKIKTASVPFLDIGKWWLMVMAMSSSMSYAAFGFLLVSDHGLSSYVRFGLGMVGEVLISFIFIRSGQELQDESANVYSAACQCDWIHWNRRNRKTLIIILLNLSNGMKMTSFGILDLGHQLLLQTLKVSYSMVLLFVNVNK